MLLHLKDFIIGPSLPTQASAHKRAEQDPGAGGLLAGRPVLHRLCQPGDLPGPGGGRQRRPGLRLAHRPDDHGLLIIVALSYYQTIHAYPSGGGSYIVARENLGTYPGWWPRPRC